MAPPSHSARTSTASSPAMSPSVCGGREAPARVTSPAARDQMQLARLAEQACVERASYPAEGGHEAKILGGHQHAAGARRSVDHPVGLVERTRERLLNEHV